MEFLMWRFFGITVCLAGVAFLGCGPKGHLSREIGLPETARHQTVALQGAKAPSSGSFNGKLNLLYEKKIRGSASSPIMVGETTLAFRTTRHRFLVIDQSSGKVICQIKKRQGIVLGPEIKDSLLIIVRRTPVGAIEVINLLTGEVIGKRTIKEIRSGPIIVENGLVFGTTSGLVALGLPGLETKWQDSVGSVVLVSPAAAGGTVYYTAGNGVIKALYGADGRLLWEQDVGAEIVSALTPARFLYLATADGKLIAMDKDAGVVVWERNFEFPMRGGVAEAGDCIYAGCTDGKVYCLSAADGTPIWEFQTEGIVTATPVVSGTMVLIGSHDRHLYCLDFGTGTQLDRHQLEGPVLFPAAVSGDRVFVTCRDNRLYCFEAH
jgi:outer membrane protein assembly factor BamB